MPNFTQTDPDIPIVFEDKHLLLINKPNGVLSQGDHTGDPDVLSLCKQYLAQKGNGGYLGLVHRIDRPVGGLMLLAKTPQAASALSSQLRDRTVQKTYHAVVEGDPPENRLLTHHLVKDRTSNIVSAVAQDHPESSEAILTFQRLDRLPKLALLEIHLQTGRPHQIRVQLAEAGYPVWGDYKYGTQQPDGRTMALRAAKLEFRHPNDKKLLQFDLPMPEREPWNRFNH